MTCLFVSSWGHDSLVRCPVMWT